MTREDIVQTASRMETIPNLLALLNRIKKDEYGDRAYPFTSGQLIFFCNPNRTENSYTSFSIPKKSGGVRTISAPIRMLKSFQVCVNRLLQAFYEAPACVTGFIPGKSVTDNAARHIGMRYVFNTDLEDFFPSIPQARVWGALKTRPFSFPERIASAIAGLCCMKVQGEDGPRYILPQGAPSSPILTNIVCHNLDWKLSGLARRFQLTYSRYADDITFSSPHYVYGADGAFMTEFRRIVAEQNFRINEKKTRLQRQGERQEVTGLVVSDRVNVTREYVRDLDNLLYIWEKYGHNAAFAKFITRYSPKRDQWNKAPEMSEVILGRLNYLKMVKGKDSPVWNRLQQRFNRIVARKETCGGTEIEYLHAYPIAEFEKVMDTTVWIYRRAEHQIRCVFTLGEQPQYVVLSRYARSRVKSILEKGGAEDLERFKKRFYIGYCHQKGAPERSFFWMVFRRPPTAGH